MPSHSSILVQTCNIKVFEAAYRLVTPVGLAEVIWRVQYPGQRWSYLAFTKPDVVAFWLRCQWRVATLQAAINPRLAVGKLQHPLLQQCYLQVSWPSPP